MHIDKYSFGSIQIDGRDYSRDVILLGDEVKGPWWREAGGHVYAPQDFEEVLAAAPEVVVLGTGYFGRVKVLDETLTALAEAGSEIVVEKTGGAVEALQPLCGRGAGCCRGAPPDVLNFLSSRAEVERSDAAVEVSPEAGTAASRHSPGNSGGPSTRPRGPRSG